MKKHINIFLLHFQDAFESRSRSFVWFLLALLNPLIALLFWYGALRDNSLLFPAWNLFAIAAYYFLLILVNAFLHVHIEEEVAFIDIQQGRLSSYLMRPISYLYLKLCTELPYRLIQGIYGLTTLIIFSAVFKLQFIRIDFMILPLTLIIAACAFAVSFIFKIIVGISAFWVTDARGLQELVFVIVLTFAGFVMPVELFPPLLAKISNILPFAYMIYYPVIALQGKLGINQSLGIIGVQLIWICILTIVYKKMWRAGVKLYTGVGL